MKVTKEKLVKFGFALIFVLIFANVCYLIGSPFFIHRLNTENNELKSIVSKTEENPYYPLEWWGICEVTAFNSLRSQTDDLPYLTASGISLDTIKDFKAVCAYNYLPFGTELIIDGIGKVKVLDRVKDGNTNIDIYFGNDVKAAKKFGRQVLGVWVIK